MYAVDAGDANGINCLGNCYENGHGVAVDKTRALALYVQAADKGNTSGMTTLLVVIGMVMA